MGTLTHCNGETGQMLDHFAMGARLKPVIENKLVLV